MNFQFDFNKYITNSEKGDFIPSGLTSERYLNVLETTLNAFSEQELLKMTEDAEKKGIEDYQTIARIICVMAVLMSRGRMLQYRAMWDRMMDVACTVPCTMSNNSLLDFGIKDIMTAFFEMEKFAKPEQLEIWRNGLKKINPYKQYSCVQTAESPIQHNINVYNISGEMLRGLKQLCDPSKYIAEQLPYHLQNCFDENGMYDDGPQPMLYDLATRTQIQIALQYGYNGVFAATLDNNLKSGALYTLFTQSAAFEFPTGGRSNQYLFNEGLIASCCEFEASRYHKLGDNKKAGAFKRAAHLAILSIDRWMKQTPPKHIKNGYPWNSAYGTEGYGYYNKYMITLGSFLVPAVLAADDCIEEFPCPAELGGYVLPTSKRFHRVFANCGGYSIQIDYKPDSHYDCKGVTRLHKNSVATETALSGGIVKCPGYSVDTQQTSANLSDSNIASKKLSNQKENMNPSNMSINPAVCFEDGIWHSLANAGNMLSAKIKSISENSKLVEFEIEYEGESLPCTLVEKYTITENTITLKACYDTKSAIAVSYEVPIIVTNGSDVSTVNAKSGKAEVAYCGGIYTVNGPDKCVLSKEKYLNRNGNYTALRFFEYGKSEITITLCLEKDMRYKDYTRRNIMNNTSLFLNNDKETIHRVYSPSLIEVLKAEAGLNENLILNPGNLETFAGQTSHTEYAFSTWGMPSFSEEEIRKYFPSLKAIFYAAGTVQSFARPFLHCGVKVFSAWAANAVPVAEYTVGQILLANKGFFQCCSAMSRGDTDHSRQMSATFPGTFGCKVGIIGAGMIGSLVIRMLKKSYHVDILVFDPFLPDEKAKELGVQKCTLEELFLQSQTISNHLANNLQTQGMLNYALFTLMKDNATFINTGRGQQIVESDLVQAFSEHPNRTAVLDVTWPESLEAGHPFYMMENVFLTPHIAGSSGDEVTRMAEYMVEEYRKFSVGLPTLYEVTEERLKTMA